jgi:hypothetical protein
MLKRTEKAVAVAQIACPFISERNEAAVSSELWGCAGVPMAALHGLYVPFCILTCNEKMFSRS